MWYLLRIRGSFYSGMMTSHVVSPISVRFGAAFVPIFIIAILAGCASLSNAELATLGSGISDTKVNFAELETYALRAKRAYSSAKEIQADYPGTVRVATPPGTSVQYFLEVDDPARTQFITIRGTANKKNLQEDLQIAVREDRSLDIPVHSGFDADARAVYSDVKNYLKPGYKTYISGHSLGGAVAALLALYLIEDKYTVDKVITFGQPRFTTKSAVARLSSLPLIRVVDENDVIPMVPPSTVLDPVHGPYDHVGPEVILLDGMYYTYLPGHVADRLSVGEFWRDSAVFDLPDHAIGRYVERIGQKTKGSRPIAYRDREKYVTEPTKRLALQ